MFFFTIFTNKPNVHPRNLSINLHFPRSESEIAKCSLHYKGSDLWNNISEEAIRLNGPDSFKFYLSNDNIFIYKFQLL